MAWKTTRKVTTMKLLVSFDEWPYVEFIVRTDDPETTYDHLVGRAGDAPAPFVFTGPGGTHYRSLLGIELRDGEVALRANLVSDYRLNGVYDVRYYTGFEPLHWRVRIGKLPQDCGMEEG